MGRYLLRRLMASIPVLIIVTMLVFMLVELAPGDAIDFFIDDSSLQYLSEDDLVAIRERLGLNDSAPVRYVKWLGRVAQGDLGYSFVGSRPVNSLLADRLRNSALLMGAGLLLGIVVGIPLGILTAVRQYSITDFMLTGLSFIGISTPAFIAGIFGLYIFAVQLQWVPAGGMRTPGVQSVADFLRHLILPALILSLSHMATIMRYTRFSMLDVLKQDYLVTARAKGLREASVINIHALRNALIPVITVIGLTIPTLVVGAIFIELIFSWPGMGQLYYTAVVSRDYPIIMGANLVIAIVVLLANLLVDVMYAAVDPRIRYE